MAIRFWIPCWSTPLRMVVSHITYALGIEKGPTLGQHLCPRSICTNIREVHVHCDLNQCTPSLAPQVSLLRACTTSTAIFHITCFSHLYVIISCIQVEAQYQVRQNQLIHNNLRLRDCMVLIANQGVGRTLISWMLQYSKEDEFHEQIYSWFHKLLTNCN